MTLETYDLTMPYTYNPNHNGARYLIGKAYKNHGEWCESIAKHHRGLDYLVNPTTKWNEGSDIESEHLSVKSANASLGRLYADTKEEIIRLYFEGCPSTHWLYVEVIGETVFEWKMDKREFGRFLENFGYLHYETGHREQQKIRIKKTSKKMLEWLNSQVK